MEVLMALSWKASHFNPFTFFTFSLSLFPFNFYPAISFGFCAFFSLIHLYLVMPSPPSTSQTTISSTSSSSSHPQNWLAMRAEPLQILVFLLYVEMGKMRCPPLKSFKIVYSTPRRERRFNEGGFEQND